MDIEPTVEVKVAMMTDSDFRRLAWYIAAAISNATQREPKTYQELFGDE